MKTCTNCNGKGEYMKTSSMDNLFKELKWCYVCKGTGKVIEREQLIKFCISATAYLNGVDESVIDANKFEILTDEELQREADWLDDMLNK